VQADAHVERPGCERLGHRLCRGYGSRCRNEGEEEGVALSVDLDAALGGACSAHGATVVGERFGVRFRAEVVQEPRRALDVREEEGDCAGRKVVAHAP